ncbi:Cysteine and glycine-rich protein 2 [Dufourea novaeangliae]|uniref:Cysteine and glycine-rich protein 2 n=1 Tax=Dufourea novaeangliae TaxID=178035 RepID=A0A154PEJ9_DUFNO|nr:Cysteine and glycine-rich protein 2 [Dufourea novaeangliae]
MSTLCDPPPSPTAVTTWYNRQHSKFRSSTFEPQKNIVIAKDCRFDAQQDTDISDLNLPYSNNDIDITEAQLSTDKTRVPFTDWNNKINESDPVREFSADNDTIPSRRKFAYPPVPPPRNPLPSRRRVSFCDVVIGDTRGGNSQNRMTKLLDARHRPCCDNDSNGERHCSSYDIWRADDSVGKHDGGYENLNVSETEENGRMHFEKSASECCNDGDETLNNKCNDIEQNTGQSRTMNEKDDDSSREDSIAYQNGPGSSNGLDENERMRGGCGGPCTPCGPRPKVSCGVVKVIEPICCCGKQPEPCRVVPSCSSCLSPCNDRRGCCPPANERPICKKTIIRCRPTCTESPACGGGGCCGGGCRGGCGKPGQTCLPAKSCSNPCRPCSPRSPPRACPPPPSCSCNRRCTPCCPSSGGGTSCCCRSKSPVCRVSRRRCSTDRADCNEGGCCRPKVTCECLGGGLDCQRCGRKVYQAEMQMVSGIPFHNICFSCYCCRKPLEPLTYQENCGEIYCKQCYVRNFGPQGYGYGVGPGALQTPM